MSPRQAMRLVHLHNASPHLAQCERSIVFIQIPKCICCSSLKINRYQRCQSPALSSTVRMPITISINEPDNAGKTTQIALLPRHWSVTLLRSLHEYDSTLGSLARDGKLGDWW